MSVARFGSSRTLGANVIMSAIYSKGGSGIASLICFVGLITIAWRASENGWRPLSVALVLILGLCWLWRFFIQPFRAGLRAEQHDKKKDS
jgi:hypothetical protein